MCNLRDTEVGFLIKGTVAYNQNIFIREGQARVSCSRLNSRPEIYGKLYAMLRYSAYT